MVSLSENVAGNPGAVFVWKTDASSLLDKEGFWRAGYRSTLDLFIPEDTEGSPRKLILKPNVTIGFPRNRLGGIETRDGGIVTNPDFVGGMIDALKKVCVRPSEIVVAEPSKPRIFFEEWGYDRMTASKGIALLDLERHEAKDLNWVQVDGVVMKGIPYVKPIGDPETGLINVPCLKTHNLSITTLAVKNLQGPIATGYKHFCQYLKDLEKYPPEVLQHFQPNLREVVTEGMKKHMAAGYPEWDENGERDEIYCQRACDSLLGVRPLINVVEGVVGRDGSGFRHGKDILANLVLAGINPVHVDMVASYLMGHDPLNIGYLRLAKERGLGKGLADITVFQLKDGKSERVRDLDSLGRLRLGVYHHGDTSRYQFF